jgi:membrane fusion protein (multidrug efflux system)
MRPRRPILDRVRRATKSVLVLVAGAAAVSTGLFGLVAACGPGDSGERDVGQPPEVEVDRVATRKIEERISATGTLVSPESVVVTTEVTGRVSDVRFTEGHRVERGRPLVVLEHGPETARVDEMRARVEETERALQRAEALQERDFAAQARIDSLRTSLARARAGLRTAEKALADHTVEAPFAGVTGRRLVSPGAYLRPGDPVTELFEIDALDLLFEVPDDVVGALRRGLEVRARTRAHPGRTFTGEVRFVGPKVDPATRSLSLEATFANEDGALKPGMFMDVELIVDERDALTIPEAALTIRGPAHYVLRLDTNDVVHRVPVKPGIRRDGFVEIVEGLDVGDRVVVAGLQKVDDGDAVRPVPDAARVRHGPADADASPES